MSDSTPAAPADITSMSVEQARAAIPAVSMFTGERGSADHTAWQARWDGLHARAYPQAPANPEVELVDRVYEATVNLSDPPCTANDAHNIRSRALSLPTAFPDGAAYAEDDTEAAHTAFDAFVLDRGLSRGDAGRLAMVLSGAAAEGVRDAKAGLTPEAAEKRLATELGGTDAAREAVRYAKAALRADTPGGAALVAALDRTGAGNNPALIRELAAIGRRIATRR